MSLNEEMTETKGSSFIPGSRDLHQRRRSHHASLCHLCLGTFGNMLYLDPCFHNFCFSCTHLLLETKAECPLCKQSFSSVYNPAETKNCSAELFLTLSAKCAKEEPPFLIKKHFIEEDGRVTEHQVHHGQYHWLAVRKKTTSEQIFPGRVQNKTPSLMKPGGYDLDNLRYQATLTSLPWPDMIDAILLLIAFGALLFICLYIYLSLVLLPE